MNKKKKREKKRSVTNIQNESMDIIVGSGEILFFFLIMRIP